MTSSPHSFAYSYRLVKKCFLKICKTSMCHNFLIFQPISIKFALFYSKIFTLSSEIKLNLFWISHLSVETLLNNAFKTIFWNNPQNMKIACWNLPDWDSSSPVVSPAKTSASLRRSPPWEGSRRHDSSARLPPATQCGTSPVSTAQQWPCVVKKRVTQKNRIKKIISSWWQEFTPSVIEETSPQKHFTEHQYHLFISILKHFKN